MGLFSRKGKPKDLKSAGDEYFTKGQWAQALAAYEKVVARDPGNIKILRRLADLRAKLGRRDEALATYREVARYYADNGFLMQAIAIHKILLRLDPEAADVVESLTELYAKRGFQTRTEEPDKPPLPRIPLFSDLDSEAFVEVVDRLVPRSLEMGGTLFRQGDPGDSIFVVTSGTVRVSRGEMILAELGEGTFFGEAAFFSHQPRNADVTAIAPTELLEIRREDMEVLMARYEGVANALAEFYRRRVLDGALAASPVFGTLPAAERKRVADVFRMDPVQPGEVVVREGDTERALFVVKRGMFAVESVPPGGGELLQLAQLGPGEFFGEVALVSGTPRTATVRAEEEGEVLRAEGADLDPLLAAYPELRRALERTRDERATATVAKFLGKDG